MVSNRHNEITVEVIDGPGRWNLMIATFNFEEENDSFVMDRRPERSLLFSFKEFYVENLKHPIRQAKITIERVGASPPHTQKEMKVILSIDGIVDELYYRHSNRHSNMKNAVFKEYGGILEGKIFVKGIYSTKTRTGKFIFTDQPWYSEIKDI